MAERSPVAFDLYGTLLDVSGLASAWDSSVADAGALALAFRRHQLEISWLLSLTETYEDFGAVSAHALDVALAEAGLELPPSRRDELLAAVGSLQVYPDAPAALDALEQAGFPLAVLSNGSPAQLESLLSAAGIRGRFGELISVEEVRIYKPAPAVYRHAAERLGRPIGEVWLVSGNPFDAAGAKAAGMRVAKLERSRSFSYPFAGPPDLVVASLTELAEALIAV